MQISGSMPTHVARAYGLMQSHAPIKPNQAAQPGAGQIQAPGQAAPASRVQPAQQPGNVARIDSVQPAGFAEKLQGLIAGATGRPVEFDDGTQAPRVPSAGPPAHSLPLYTRSADKVEAAVAVNTGRAVDVRG